ncbi:dynein axonemal assembly factor 5 isoform X1 [Neodiprion virginianus]|uniref:dynein axonemal assembly factor 5 isoform X1 n=1 Tax=Neodiprion virginianus TaxID=2961670 RepID=UPI001EE74B63|nr:dynein axonemal assembly factor 5 isoform X1 [Neodiprion virginianus]XP_046614037.1 dynein axonemal assembly factor 5 isoform X1 [Neodiprion virginianus]
MSSTENIQLGRISVALQAEDKRRRKAALQELDDLVFGKNEPMNVDEVAEVWEIMHHNLVRALNDQAEACRDFSINLLKKFFGVLTPCEKNIIYVIPMATRRLGSQEIVEPSEEVRLNFVTLLRTVIQHYKDYLSAYLGDFITILGRTVTDNYPSVKKESCTCISELAKTIPNSFYNHCDSLVKPVLTNFAHQHYKVRVASVNTIGDVVQYGNNKIIEIVATPMAERLFDQSGGVRMAVVEVAGKWLLKLGDRYSWWHKLIPLLLTGLHDEVEVIRNTARKLWEAVGEQYIKENDNDEKLRDKLDYLGKDPEHYPSNIVRPNLGCRTITQQNLCKLVGGIGVELGDWMADIRVRSAQLLCVLVLNVEQDVTQHIEKILPSMYRACNDEDKRVVENVELAAEYMGYFVPPDVYCHLVLPTLEENPTPGHFRVFSAILRGSNRKLLVPKLEIIGGFLQQAPICRGKNFQYQKQILQCCKSLMIVCQENCQQVSRDLFTVIFTVLSLAADEEIRQESFKLLEKLAEIEDLPNVEELYECQLRSLLKLIESNRESWTIYSSELLILRACLVYTGSAASQHLDLILPMLKQTMGKEADPELRLEQFLLLSNYLMRRQENLRKTENLSEFITTILDEIILPSLVWSAGRTAEAIRTAAVCCLCTALDENPNYSENSTSKFGAIETNKLKEMEENENELSIMGMCEKESELECEKITKSDEQFAKKCLEVGTNKTIYELQLFPDTALFLKFFNNVMPILTSLVDDNAKKTRLYSLRAICQIMSIGEQLSCLNDEHVHQVYPVVLKRLDDGCDDVRFVAVRTLRLVWAVAPKDYDIVFSKSHIDTLYTSTIVHLDDPDPKFQEITLETMKPLAKLHPELLAQKIQSCKGNFRNQRSLEVLLEYTYDLLSRKS